MRDQKARHNQKEEYVEQIQYVNGQILEIVEVLIQKSSIQPLIIIQADHGPSIEMHEKIYEDEDLMETRMSILNALYLPDEAVSRVIYSSITPVNTFRMIFNTFFDAGFNYLADQSYFSTYERPYKFIPIKKYPITPRPPSKGE